MCSEYHSRWLPHLVLHGAERAQDNGGGRALGRCSEGLPAHSYAGWGLRTKQNITFYFTWGVLS